MNGMKLVAFSISAILDSIDASAVTMTRVYPVNAQIQVDDHNLAIHCTTVLQGKT